jgi:hypothetical protein
MGGFLTASRGAEAPAAVNFRSPPKHILNDGPGGWHTRGICVARLEPPFARGLA